MKIKQTVKRLLLGLFLVVGLAGVAAPTALADCGGVSTTVINCNATGKGTCLDGTVIAGTDKCPDGSSPKVAVKDTGVWGVLLFVINILTAGIGVVAVAGIVYASIVYITAGGDANQTKKSMMIITNIVIGVVAYALMYALLNFLIPG
jgi:hypothetical protein